MKVLITGVNGFFGRRLAEELLKKGHYIVGVGCQKKCFIENISKYYSGSVLDKKIVEKAVNGVEAVVHLAALTTHEDLVHNKFETLAINFLGTKNILGAFSQSSTTKKFIYTSSGKVYGITNALPLTEEHQTKPLNILGKSKLITEQLIDFYSSPEKSFIIFRIFNAYGPRQKRSFLLPTILDQIKYSNSITLGDINAKRDYTYIDDVLNSFILAIEKDIGGGLSMFNICSNNPISAKKIVSIIEKIKKIKIEIKINSNLFRKDEADTEYGSYDKAKNILGWMPKYSLKEGIMKTIEAQE